MEFFDKVTPKNVRRTDDGYLVADAPVARAGVQLYRGAEICRPDLPFVRVYRPESEVFDEKSLRSYAHRPLTNDHPAEMVTAENWKDLSIGTTGDEVLRDGDTIRVPLVLMDAAAIEMFYDGKRELSMGYTAEIEFTDGEMETEDGLKYDAVQRNLRMNHLALVDRGRAGVAKIGDERTPNTYDAPTTTGGRMAEETKKVVVDGLSVITNDQGAEAIELLQSKLTEATTQLDAFIAVCDTKDAELAERDAEVSKLKAEIADTDLDALIALRAELLTEAKSINDADYSGKSAEEIKLEVVVAKLGDSAVEGKSEAYIQARYDILVEDSKNVKEADPVLSAVADAKPVVVVDADAAYAKYVERTESAYKQQ